MYTLFPHFIFTDSAFNDWISSLKNFKTKNNTNFIRAGFTLDGSFEVEGEVTEPFSVSLPSTKGSLDEPFVLDLIEMVHLREENEDLPKPSISLDLDIPDIGDLRNLSFGDLVRILKTALEFLVGPTGDVDSQEAVESCSDGLLKDDIFNFRIPVLGFSACQKAIFLKTLVDAVDQLVEECDCDDKNEDGDVNSTSTTSTGTFTVLEEKLEQYLNAGGIGTSDVAIVNRNNDDRSQLDLDIAMAFTFAEAQELGLDLAAVFEGQDLDEQADKFRKGFVGRAFVDMEGSVEVRLGVGFEYDKKTKEKRGYIKGLTGLVIRFAAESTLDFTANIGPFGATVVGDFTVDGPTGDLSIKLGLDDNYNYYLTNQESLVRGSEGPVCAPDDPCYTVVDGLGDLTNEVGSDISGQVHATIEADLSGIIPGRIFVQFDLKDINLALEGNPSAYSVIFTAEFDLGLFDQTSLITILLEEPQGIVDAIDDILESAEKATLGLGGALSRTEIPYLKNRVAVAMGAGTSGNFLSDARFQISGTLQVSIGLSNIQSHYYH